MLLPLRASVFLLLLLLNSTIVRSFLHTRRRRTISFPASDVVVALPRRLSAVVHEEEEERRATTSGGSGGWDNAFDLVDDDEGFLRAALSEEFGIHEPNEMQNESIAAAVRGDDTLVIAQTGSGKTMSFLLPILRRLNDDDDDDDKASSSSSRKPVAIVIGPTSELLAQHARVASKLMPSAAVADRVLFKTPEQVLDNDCLRCHDDDENDDDNPLLLENIEIVAIDEVDAVLCGSSDFDDAVPERTMKLLGSLPSSERTQFILTTAHLTRAHARTIRRLFPGIETIRQTGSSQSRVLVPTLRQVFHYFSGDDATAKLEKLRDVLLAVERSSEEEGKKKRQRRRDPTVVFCRDEVEVETVHRFLVSTSTTTTTGNGCAAPLLRDAFAPEKLHAGMPSEERSTALSLFRDGGGDENENDDGGCRMLVTHEIAARGLDFPSVRHVVLFDTPTDVTAFVHRAGRTARAGEEGVVTCLVQAGGGGGGSGGFGSFGEHKDLHALLEAPKLDFAKKKKKKKPNDDDDDDDDGG